MHPISYEMQFEQRAAEMRKTAADMRRAKRARVPKQRKARHGKKITGVIATRLTKA